MRVSAARGYDVQMLPPPPQHERMRSLWESIAARYAAYQLTMPGSPTFVCQADLCNAHCCRAFSVNLGEREVERMQRASGLQPLHFLESVDGVTVKLPLAQPYLLKRAENGCAQLGPGLSCGQYDGRPNACRLYPHFVLFIDPASLRPVHAETDGMRASFAAAAAIDGAAPGPYVPLLLRHVECPGFTGDAMSSSEWRSLFEDTFRLQYPGS
jgi:hypothetical protein